MFTIRSRREAHLRVPDLPVAAAQASSVPTARSDPGRSAAVVQRSSRKTQPGLEQIALVRDAHRPEQIADDEPLIHKDNGALPVTLSRWSLNKVDEASLLPWHSAPGAARPASRASN